MTRRACVSPAPPRLPAGPQLRRRPAKRPFDPAPGDGQAADLPGPGQRSAGCHWRSHGAQCRTVASMAASHGRENTWR